MRIAMMVLLALIASARHSAVHAWGNDGHHIVGAIADTLIHGTNAERNVRVLLQGSDLETYAIWADCAKGYCHDWFDDEMRRFVQANPKHHDYHYTDMPIQEPVYRPNSVGANDVDVVHELNNYIAVLRNGPITGQNWVEKRLALIMIDHLIGDIHQPLHVGAVYVGENETFVNPNTVTGFTETQGGNFLMRTASGNLHSFWDSDSVKQAVRQSHSATPDEFASLLAAEPNTPTPGDPATWPLVWANESLVLARNAFDGIELGPRRIVSNDRGGTHPEWRILAIPADYKPFAGTTAGAQLARAGHRLAELLMAIWP